MRSGSNATGRTQLRAGTTGTSAHRMAAGAAEDGGGIARVDDTESTSQESTEANGPDRAGDADGGEVQPEASGFLRRGVQRVLELLSPQPKRPANSQRVRTGHAADSGNDDDAHIPAGLDDRSMDVDGGGDAARPKSAAPDRRKPKTRGASSKKGGQGGRAKGGKATAKGRSATEEEDFDSDEAEARCEAKVKNRESLQNLNFDKMKRRELVVYAKFLLRNKGAVHGAKKDLVPQLNAERDRRLATWDEEDGEDLPEEREEGRAVFQRQQEEEEQPQQADLEKQGAEEAMEGSSPMMNGPVAKAAQVGHDDQDRRKEHMDIGGAEAAGDEMDGGMEGMEEERQEEIKHESTGPPGVPVYRPALYRPELRLNHEESSIANGTFSPDPALGQGRTAAPVETRMPLDTHRRLTEKEKEDLLSTARRTKNKQPKEAASQPGTTGLVGPPRPGSAFGGYIPLPRPGGAVGRGDGLLEQHDAMPSRNEITSGDEELDFLAQRARDSNAPSFRNMHATRRERPAVHYDDQIDARDDLQRTRYAVTPFASSRLPTRYPPSSQRHARIRSREEMEGRGADSEHRAKRRRQVEPSTPRWSDQVASRIKENVRNAQQRTPVQSGRRPYLPATSMRPLLFDEPAVEMSPSTRSEAVPEPRTQQTALVSHRAPAVGRGVSAESRLGIEQRSAAKRQRDEAVREVSQVSNLPEPTAVFGNDGDVAGGGWEDDDAEFRFRAPLPVDEVPDDDGMGYDDEDRGPAREQDFTFTPAQKKRRRRQEEPEKSGQAKQASVGAAPSAAADRMAMPPPPPRPAAPRAPAPAAVPPAGGGFVGFDHLRPKGWKCNTCFVTDNPESTNICLSCEAPRPGMGGAGVGSGAATPAVPGVSPAQSKPFASSAPKSTGGSIGSSGFVFGNKSDAGGSSFRAFGGGASGPESRSSGLGTIAASSPPSALTSSAAPSPASAPSTANFFGSAAARTAPERGFTAPAPAPAKSSKRVAAPTAPTSDNTDAAYPGGDFEFVAGQTPPALTNAAPTPTAVPVPAPVPATSAPAGATIDTAPAPATSAASPALAPTPAPFAFGGAGTGSLFGSVPAVSPSTSASGSAASGATPSAQAPFTFSTGDGKAGSGLGGGDGKLSAPTFTFPSPGAAFGSVLGPTSGAAPSSGGVTHGFSGAPPASTPSTTASAAPTPSAAPAPATTATTTSAPSSTTATTVSVAAPAPATSGLSLFPRTSTTLPATNFPAFGSAAGTSVTLPASSSSGAPPTSSFVPFGSSSSAAPTTSAPAAAPSTTTTTPSTVFSPPAPGFGFGTTMVPGAPAKPATDASKTSTASTPGTGFSFGISGAGAAPLSFGLAAGTGATPAAGVVGRSTSGSGMDIAGGTSPKQQQPAGGLTLAPAPAPAGGLSLSLGSTPAPAPAPAPFATPTFGQTPAPAPGFGFGALGSGSTTGPFAAPAPVPGPTPFSSTPSGGLFGQGASGGGANPFSAGAAAPAPASFGGFGLSTGAGTGSGTPSFTFGSTGPSGPLLGTTPSQPTPTFGVSAPAPTAPVFGAGSAGGGAGFRGFGGGPGGGGGAQANGGGFSLGAATSQAPAGRKFIKGKRPGRR